jgi:hypothetical protein
MEDGKTASEKAFEKGFIEIAKILSWLALNILPRKQANVISFC